MPSPLLTMQLNASGQSVGRVGGLGLGDRVDDGAVGFVDRRLGARPQYPWRRRDAGGNPGALLALLHLLLGVEAERDGRQQREQDAADQQEQLRRRDLLGVRRGGREQVLRLLGDERPHERVRDAAYERRDREPPEQHVRDHQAVALERVGQSRHLHEEEWLPIATLQHFAHDAERAVAGLEVVTEVRAQEVPTHEERDHAAARLADDAHDHAHGDAEERPGRDLEQRAREAEGQRGPGEQRQDGHSRRLVCLDPVVDAVEVLLDLDEPPHEHDERHEDQKGLEEALESGR